MKLQQIPPKKYAEISSGMQQFLSRQYKTLKNNKVLNSYEYVSPRTILSDTASTAAESKALSSQAAENILNFFG